MATEQERVQALADKLLSLPPNQRLDGGIREALAAGDLAEAERRTAKLVRENRPERVREREYTRKLAALGISEASDPESYFAVIDPAFVGDTSTADAELDELSKLRDARRLAAEVQRQAEVAKIVEQKALEQIIRDNNYNVNWQQERATRMQPKPKEPEKPAPISQRGLIKW